jgi:cytidylate kinase
MDGVETAPIVAIDGPAGAGKSTIARLLAARLGFTYIDTGAMYRAVALLAERAGVSWDDEGALGRLVENLSFEFDRSTTPAALRVNGEDLSALIRSPEISQGASRVARWQPVREALVRAQRRIGAKGGVVMEGRDIGTVVFPNAALKVFLTASVEERARRRVLDLLRQGSSADLEEVRREVEQRDARDAERDLAPMVRAADAVEVATDGLSIEEVVERLAALAAYRRFCR